MNHSVDVYSGSWWRFVLLNTHTQTHKQRC